MRIAKGIEPLLKRIALRSVRKRGNQLRLPIDPESIRSVLIYRPERYGDVLATLPLVDAMKSHHPEWQITLWTSEAGAQIAHGEPAFADVTVLRGTAWDRARLDTNAAFDLVIDMVMHDSVNALLTTSQAARDGVLVGWGKQRFAAYYDWAPPLTQSRRYNPHLALDLLALIGLDHHRALPVVLHYTQHEIEWAEAAFKSDTTTAVLNVSAGDDARRLPESTCAAVVEHLHDHTPHRIAINALGQDRTTVAHLCDLDPERIHLLPPSDYFRDIACAVSRAAMFISPNTSLVHIAAGANVPTVTLEPPDRPPCWDWVPPGDHVVAIDSAHPEGVAGIPAARITTAIDTLLASTPSEAASA